MTARTDSAGDETEAVIGRLLAGYRPLPGIHDEMMDRDGRLRSHWRPFLSLLAALGEEEIARRFAAADRHLRESGVFYRVYEDPAGAERAWPTSHVPLILEPTEWERLKSGLIQRAGLLEAVLADAYGPARLVREGRLPAALIAGNPEFLRPLVGVEPPGGAHLRFYSVDVGRGLDGRWWVLGDRTQAPSGAGFALENRLALSRALPDIYRELKVNRLAPFFQAFQAEMSRLTRREDARVCLLTPGPMNDTYFEHAFLARYLGFLLVEGEDLTAREDGVFIRTVSGLQRADVLLRRLDADFSDPLELNARSRLGVLGLVQAVRDHKVVVVNGLGAGLVEARAMLAFLPALAPHVLDEELAVPNIATWWLGNPEVRAGMIGKLDDMVIASAFFDLASESIEEGVIGGVLEPAQRQHIVRRMIDRGIDFVLQEAASLSTMPVWQDGKLVPRPFSLRLFLARIGDGWNVMPGGFVRVARDVDARAVSLQKGGCTADAWVPSCEPVAAMSLLPAPDRMTVRRTSGTLPSRAADNLFWVGRYVERAEATLRLVRALIGRSADADEASAAVVASISGLLQAWSAGPNDIPHARPALVARAALQRSDCDGSLPWLVNAARAAASVIRDRFSPDAWRALTGLAETIEAPLPSGLSESAMFERTNAALRILASFSGLAQENMTQLAGWRFLEIGRRIERAVITCRFVRQFAGPPVIDRGLDVLLELCDSQITYRQRYMMIAARAPTMDLVMLDPNNPRSVVYQVGRIEAHLASLAQHRGEGLLSAPEQIALAMATALRTVDPVSIEDDLPLRLEAGLMKLSDAVAHAYLIQNELTEGRWEAPA